MSESTLHPGYRIDRYQLLYPVARGGMGEIWAAHLKGGHGFEKICAIKTILPKFASEPEFRAMFLDEGLIASAILHPNVVQVFDLGEHNAMLYMAMEWVEGDSLQRIIRRVESANGRIPLAIALRIMADVCAGLHAAHELADRNGGPLDVVHRDVSPANVLVSTGGIAKLTDFGIVKARNRVAGDTNESVIKGKVRFMAPEQFEGDRVDRRTDLFSVGAILYRMITGEAPFAGRTDFEVVARIIQAKAPPPMGAEIAPDLVPLLERTLAPNPDQRFSTALELQSALEVASRSVGAATHSDVSAYVREQTKEEAEQRRVALETAIARINETATTSRPQLEVPTMPERALEHDPIPIHAEAPVTATSTSAMLGAVTGTRRRKRALAVEGTVLAAASIGVVVFGGYALHSATPPSSSPPVVASPPAPSVSMDGESTATALPTEISSSGASASSSARAERPSPSERVSPPHVRTVGGSAKPAPSSPPSAEKVPPKKKTVDEILDSR